MEALTQAQKMVVKFKEEQIDLVLSYGGNSKAKDVPIEYINTYSCQKPSNASPQEYVDPIKALCKFTNRIYGLKQDLEEDDIKLTIYNSSPKAWQTDYLKAGRDMENDKISNIVSYMNLCWQEFVKTKDNAKDQEMEMGADLEADLEVDLEA